MTTKPYKAEDTDQPASLSEPLVSYAASQDISALKLEAIDEVMNLFDPDLLLQAIDYLRTLGQTEKTQQSPPCQFSVEELHQRVRYAMELSRQGQGVSQEEMRKRKPVWR